MIINVIVEHFCKELVIEVETENEVPTDLRDATNKLCLELNPDAVDVKKYIVGFLQKTAIAKREVRQMFAHRTSESNDNQDVTGSALQSGGE